MPVLPSLANERLHTLIGSATFEMCITDLLLLDDQLPWLLLDRVNSIKFVEERGKKNIKFNFCVLP